MAQAKYKYTTTNYIGETTQGVANPVFFDPHNAQRNNKPPISLITGAPGNGKTFFLQTLVAQSAIMGKTNIVADWKGDFLSLVNLQNEIGPVMPLPIGAGSLPGTLDPFNMARTKNEMLTLCINLIDILVGGLTRDDQSVLSPIIQDVINSNTHVPSMDQVTQACRSSQDPTARQLGGVLDLISKSKEARVCFDASGTHTPKLHHEGQTTVATLQGLELPNKTPGAKNTEAQRLGQGVFYLLGEFVKRVLEDSKSRRPSLFAVDEAWALFSTPSGVELAKQFSLLGRSKNAASIFATQNYTHLADLDLDNMISTHFAFGAEPDEAMNIVRGMNLSENEGFDGAITNFNNGECLMRDWRKNYATLQISDWKTSWANAFETNPFEQ